MIERLEAVYSGEVCPYSFWNAKLNYKFLEETFNWLSAIEFLQTCHLGSLFYAL